jgi:RHS repeat-associated protein
MSSRRKRHRKGRTITPTTPTVTCPPAPTDGATTTFAHNADSELTSTVMPNGVTESRAYDAADQLTGVDDTTASATVTSYGYTYDKAGNPTSIVTPTETDGYTYDSQNRLTKVCDAANCADGSTTWTYDADGNPTDQATASASTVDTFNTDDELASTTTGSTTVKPVYDADGRLITSGSTSYTYNAADELTSVTTPTGTTSYTYNGDGLRATATTGKTTTSFSYDTNAAVPELAAESVNGTQVRRYLWADGLLLSERTAGADYYIAHDAQGSTVAVTSPTGTTEAVYTYAPYGAPRSTTLAAGAPTVPLRWEGEYLDADGQYYLDARELTPTTDTFNTTDPLPQIVATPQTSSYDYAEGQPTVLADPTGEFSVGSLLGHAEDAAADLVNSVGAGNFVLNHHAQIVSDVTTFAVGVAGTAVGIADDVYTGAEDISSIASSCSEGWASQACGIAIQKTGVDVAVGLLSTLCLGTVVLAAACSTAVSAGGAYLLDRYGIQLPASNSGTTVYGRNEK